MDPDRWTPARGWLIGLGLAALRSAIAGVFFGAIIHFAWPMTEGLSEHWSLLSLILIASAAAGVPLGLFVGRKLADASGLAGRTLALPVLVILLLGEGLGECLAGSLHGRENLLLIDTLAIGMTIGSAAACIRALLRD